MAGGGRVRIIVGLVLVVAVAVITALVLVLPWGGGDGSNGPTGRAVRQEGSEGRGTVQAASVQEGRARTVVIERAELPQPGYVAVYASADGAPGELLGTSDRLGAGRHDDLRIRLAQRLRHRTDVVAVIHTEDGDTTGLDFPDGDPPFTDDTGGVVALPISITPD